MEFHKLKLVGFQTYLAIRSIKDFYPPLKESDKPEVYFSFVSSMKEVLDTINVVQNNQKHKENRVFFVFKKGNKTFGRDHIYNMVMQHGGFQRKAPILASLNKEYSTFCFMMKV